jgi:hypothetical protein
MAAEHLKSAHITNATATPVVLTNAAVAGGRLLESCGTIAPAAAAEANSTYRVCRVPSNARISQVLISAADFTTAGAINVGLYDTADNGGAVVDADLFASAYPMQSGPYTNSDITHESGEYTVVEAEKPLWEVLGLSADPCKEYDVAATVSTAFDGGQTMHLKCRFAI